MDKAVKASIVTPKKWKKSRFYRRVKKMEIGIMEHMEKKNKEYEVYKEMLRADFDRIKNKEN